MATRAKTQKTRAKAKSPAKRAVKKVTRAAKKATRAAKKAAKPVKRKAKVATSTLPPSPALTDRERTVTVDDYLTHQVEAPWRAVMAELLMVVKTACPEAVESIKWGQPVYECNGLFAWMRPHRGYVNFGFWRGAELADPDQILEGTGELMRHVRIDNPEEVPLAKIDALVRQAVELNRSRGAPPAQVEPKS